MNATKSKKTSTPAEPVYVERIANDAPKFNAAFGVGDASHQGDLIIVGIASLPKSAKPRKNRQLADGDTQGSRHIVERGQVFDADAREVGEMIKQATKQTVAEQYIGPVFVSPDEPTANDVTHPEHGNQGFPAGTVCAVVVQRNLDAEEREVKTRD